MWKKRVRFFVIIMLILVDICLIVWRIDDFKNPIYFIYTILLLIWAYPFLYESLTKAQKMDNEISEILQKTKEQCTEKAEKEKTELINRARADLNKMDYYSLFHFFSDLINQLKAVIFFLCIQLTVIDISPSEKNDIETVFSYMIFLITNIVICLVIWLIEQCINDYKSIILMRKVSNHIEGLISTIDSVNTQ